MSRLQAPSQGTGVSTQFGDGSIHLWPRIHIGSDTKHRARRTAPASHTVEGSIVTEHHISDVEGRGGGKRFDTASPASSFLCRKVGQDATVCPVRDVDGMTPASGEVPFETGGDSGRRGKIGLDRWQHCIGDSIGPLGISATPTGISSRDHLDHPR